MNGDECQRVKDIYEAIDQPVSRYAEIEEVFGELKETAGWWLYRKEVKAYPGSLCSLSHPLQMAVPGGRVVQGSDGEGYGQIPRLQRSLRGGTAVSAWRGSLHSSSLVYNQGADWASRYLHVMCGITRVYHCAADSQCQYAPQGLQEIQHKLEVKASPAPRCCHRNESHGCQVDVTVYWQASVSISKPIVCTALAFKAVGGQMPVVFSEVNSCCCPRWLLHKRHICGAHRCRGAAAHGKCFAAAGWGGAIEYMCHTHITHPW